MIFALANVVLAFLLWLFFRHAICNWWDTYRGVWRTIFWHSYVPSGIAYIAICLYSLYSSNWDLFALAPFSTYVILTILLLNITAVGIVSLHRAKRVKRISNKIDFRNMMWKRRQQRNEPANPAQPSSIELLPPDRPHEEVIQELLKKNKP